MFECRNCQGARSTPLYPALRDRFHGFPGSFDYVACAACGLVQLETVPEQLGEFYAAYRVHAGDSRLYRLLRRLTIGHCYFEPDGHGRALLDVGCGNGWYLQAMRARGWKVTGYEFDPGYSANLAQAIGCPVVSADAALSEMTAQFDLVTFNFSFEHLSAPRRFLELARACLRPGGTIYLSVPNIESLEAKLFKDRWFHLDPPRHVSFFTKDLLRRALEAAGFSNARARDLAVPTGWAGSWSYRLWDRFDPLTWYASIVPGMLFSAVVRDGNFAMSATRS